MPMPTLRSLPFVLPPFVLPLVVSAMAWAQQSAPATAGGDAQAAGAQAAAPDGNPYRLQPFHTDFPVPLEYPPQNGREYDRTRRQMLERLVANLGMARREAWQLATEFFWRGPEDAVEPLIAQMDKAMANPALSDIVKNTVEAMGKMAQPEFDAALRRALTHKHPAVVQAAYAALATSGSEATLRQLATSFELMDARSRTQWLRSLRLRLGGDAVPFYRAIMDGPYTTQVRDQVLVEALQLPMAQAADVLRGRWQDAAGEFKAVIAGVLHAAGDSAGTSWLRDALQNEDMAVLTLAVKHCVRGELGDLRDPLLRASTHLNPDVRYAVVQALVRVPGDDVSDVLEVLVGPEQPWEIRSIATRELVKRGRRKVVDVLLEEVGSATGTRLNGLLSQLTASGDPRAVPVLLERFEKAPPGEGRPFLMSLAQNSSADAAKALLQLYRGPVRLVGKAASGTLTTRNYLPTLLLNLRGSEDLVLAAYQELPKAEWQLRAPLLQVLVGIAADRENKELAERFVAPVRAVLFDRDELPQLRVLALNLLSFRWILIEDALKLKNLRQQESPQMRALFTDFLLDAF
jgi:HEAT repeat protein